MTVALATLCHDPEGRLLEQTRRVLPALARIFSTIAVRASPLAPENLLALLESAGALVRRQSGESVDSLQIGTIRRESLELALQTDAPFILYCDDDRVLHWAERYPDELAAVVARLPEHDFTVLGRTPRAFGTHPRIQRDTEAIINHVYSLVSGNPWDVTGAARGLSRRAAQAILAGCPDREISTDVSWPLFIQQAGDLSVDYLETEGLEFETADRYAGEVAAARSLAAWMAGLDADPRRWARRLELARIEVEAMLPYSKLA